MTHRAVTLRKPIGEHSVSGRFCGVLGSLINCGEIEPVYGFAPDSDPHTCIMVRAEDLIEVPEGD